MICQICNLQNRKEVDRALIEGYSIVNLAKENNVSYQSMYNHLKNHIHRQLITAVATKESEHQFQLLEKIEGIVNRAERIFRRNYSKGKDVVALKALSEQRSTFELLAKIAAHLQQLKKMELEAQQAGNIHDFGQTIQKAFDVLSIDELKVFQLLSEKIMTGDRSINIELPTKQEIITKFPQGYKPEAQAQDEDIIPIPKMVRGMKPESPLLKDVSDNTNIQKVRPVEHDEIPCYTLKEAKKLNVGYPIPRQSV